MCVTNTVGQRYRQVLFDRAQLALAPATETNSSLIPVTEPVPSNHPAPKDPATVHDGISSPRRDKQRKRRYQPLHPGKTAKNNDRHFVVHCYHDHAKDDLDSHTSLPAIFPVKLHQVLDDIARDGLDYIVSWAPHGRCFIIHKPKEFVDQVLPQYFRQSKITSFQRQLNLYGFNRLTKGLDKGGYYSEFFLRGKPALCQHMVRTKIKGTGFKAAGNPDQEPDLYALPPVVPDCDSSVASNAAPDVTPHGMLNVDASSDEHDFDIELGEIFSSNSSYSCSSLPGIVSPSLLDDDAASIDMVDELCCDASMDQDMFDTFCHEWAPSSETNLDVKLSHDWWLEAMLKRLVD